MGPRIDLVLLDRVIDACDRTDGPVTVRDLTDQVEDDRASIRARLHRLAAHDLLEERPADRFAPTSGGRQLNALELSDAGSVIIDS